MTRLRPLLTPLALLGVLTVIAACGGTYDTPSPPIYQTAPIFDKRGAPL